MKTCPHCSSSTFDDMERCYDCMSLFESSSQELDSQKERAAVRLQVALTDYFSYELLLQKMDGRSLSIGSDSENAIVIPEKEVAAHQLEVFYAHGHIWAENIDQSQNTVVGELPLYGTVCLKPGTEISIGNATITLLD